jgi:hypothetical protein
MDAEMSLLKFIEGYVSEEVSLTRGRAGEKAKAGRPSNNPSDDARDSRGAPTILSEPGVILQSELWRPGGGRSIHTPLGVR